MLWRRRDGMAAVPFFFPNKSDAPSMIFVLLLFAQHKLLDILYESGWWLAGIRGDMCSIY